MYYIGMLYPKWGNLFINVPIVIDYQQTVLYQGYHVTKLLIIRTIILSLLCNVI